MRLVPRGSTLVRWWRKASIVIVVAAIAVAVYAFAWAVNNSEASKNLAQENLNSQNNHHASTVKTQGQLLAKDHDLQQALDDVKTAAKAIEYEGGVIAYQNGEIIAAQQAGHATLDAITALQMSLSQAEGSVGTALVGGQKQINAYLGYLTCLVTNQTNMAVCGPPPPLPST